MKIAVAALLIALGAPIQADDAADLLRSRGNHVDEDDGKTKVSLVPSVGDKSLAEADVQALNRLQGVVELRIIASEGISPTIFGKLNELPEVKLVAIHYRMPEESIRFLDRFPNVEILKFWADSFVSCEELPKLEKLRVLHHESTEGDFTMKAVERIAACQNLEEIIILRPIPEEGIGLLKNLPHLQILEVNETVYRNNAGEQVAGDKRR